MSLLLLHSLKGSFRGRGRPRNLVITIVRGMIAELLMGSPGVNDELIFSMNQDFIFKTRDKFHTSGTVAEHGEHTASDSGGVGYRPRVRIAFHRCLKRRSSALQSIFIGSSISERLFFEIPRPPPVFLAAPCLPEPFSRFPGTPAE